MFKFIVVFYCAFALVNSASVKEHPQKKRGTAEGHLVQETHGYGVAEEVSGHEVAGHQVAGHQVAGHEVVIASYGGGAENHIDAGGHSGGSGAGKYVSGAELTSLAHTSAIQAKTAVASQHTAGSQAAFGAKSSLAQAALGAASTAQAALVGKQVIVQSLEHQLHDAEKQLKAEIAQYHLNEQAAVIAQQAAADAQALVNSITAILTSSQGGAQHAAQAASEASAAAASQHAMIQTAKQRISKLTEELHTAVGELQQTEASAHKAAHAAEMAQANAAAAANAVAASAAAASADKGEHGSGVHNTSGGGQAEYYHH